jgi:hypothetical protein
MDAANWAVQIQAVSLVAAIAFEDKLAVAAESVAEPRKIGGDRYAHRLNEVARFAHAAIVIKRAVAASPLLACPRAADLVDGAISIEAAFGTQEEIDIGSGVAAKAGFGAGAYLCPRLDNKEVAVAFDASTK